MVSGGSDIFFVKERAMMWSVFVGEQKSGFGRSDLFNEREEKKKRAGTLCVPYLLL